MVAWRAGGLKTPNVQALKNPAGAGFKKIVEDQAAGVMLDACAPFGPWVNS